MKAVLLTKHGGPEVLQLGEVPDPTAITLEQVEAVLALFNATARALQQMERRGLGPGTREMYRVSREEHKGMAAAWKRVSEVWDW